MQSKSRAGVQCQYVNKECNWLISTTTIHTPDVKAGYEKIAPSNHIMAENLSDEEEVLAFLLVFSGTTYNL